jgi:hypothetical protein
VLLVYLWRRRRRIRSRYPDGLYLLRRLEDAIHDERKGSPQRDELLRLRTEMRALLRGRRDEHAAAILMAARAQMAARAEPARRR